MGYRIEYLPTKKTRNHNSRRSRILGLTGMFFLTFLIMTHIFAPQAVEILQEILIPGDNAVTVAAFDHLCTDLRAHIGISEAIQTFCRQIILGGIK